jgi:TPP-dependent pyruvate/acetoin dehydrogenase alpha subunit
MSLREKVAREIQRSREVQLEINRMIISGEFKIPIHLAIGHEAIATSLINAIQPKDKLLFTHRNIHYHLALGASKEELIQEYLLKINGLAAGKLGSMNLMNPTVGNIYTSNILGNNLAVSLGVGLASKILNCGQVIWAITGDGAIEEGVFYEAALLASSIDLPVVFLIENNGWSLGTSIPERRQEIDLNGFAKSISIGYMQLSNNDPIDYISQLKIIRENVSSSMRPFIIEVDVHSLGGFYKEEDLGSKRYVNYHAGAIRFDPDSDKIFERNSKDPMYVVLNDLIVGK